MMWGRLARALLAPFEQTPFLPLYLRLMGARIGRSALLGSGFAQLVDPDMLTIESGATFQGLLQAHSFEDRVLKIDRVHVAKDATVGAGAVLLYGARIGERAEVIAHSVVMKREHLLPDRRHRGCPTSAE
jgi:non-ribosomal peptide synthetase-like protein